MEHLGTMVIAIVLVTLGRALSKRAKEERTKQKRVAIFYLIALALMLWATPWPFREIGHGRGWL
jgi:RsiW-degrading membrane proteinase PrsW (M82 family)